MVDVVCGDARDHGLRRPAPEACAEGGLGEILDDVTEAPVLALEKRLRVGDRARGLPDRRRKEVRAFERERPALLAGEPAPDRVLPVSGMQDEVVDRVALRSGPEERDGRRQRRGASLSGSGRATTGRRRRGRASRGDARGGPWGVVYLRAPLHATPRGLVTARAETSRERRGAAGRNRASTGRGEGGRHERGREFPRRRRSGARPRRPPTSRSGSARAPG